jgi:hypothetical protein
MPAVPLSDVADRRHRPAGHQATDAVWFRAMHLLAQGKKGLSNIELGRRLGISTNAAWRVQPLGLSSTASGDTPRRLPNRMLGRVLSDDQ